MSPKITLENILPQKPGNKSHRPLGQLALAEIADRVGGEGGSPAVITRPTTLYSELRKAKDEEILGWVETNLNVFFPRKAFCEEHVAPAEAFLKIFRDETTDAVMLANRNGGKTTMFSTLSFMDSINYANCETYMVAGSKEQAGKGYKYTKAYWDTKPEFHDMLEKEPMISETSLKNGSIIKVLAGSTTSVHGSHGQKLKADEIEEMEWNVFQGCLSIPQSKLNIEASTILASTRHKAFGIMEDLVNNHAKMGYVLYQWCYKEIAAKCPFNCIKYDGIACGVYSKCPLWDRCQGALHHSRGYYSVKDIISKFLKVDEETWVTQWECKQPVRAGLVFDASQIREADSLVYSSLLPTYVCIDWGYSAPAVFLLVQESNSGEMVRVIDELRLQFKTDPELLEACEKFIDGRKIEMIYADGESPESIELFRKAGLPIRGIPFNKYKYRAIKERRNYYRQGRIVFNSDTCDVVLKEEKSLHYEKDSRNEPTETIAKGNDHGSDAFNCFFTKYILAEEYRKEQEKKRVRVHTLADIRKEKKEAEKAKEKAEKQ